MTATAESREDLRAVYDAHALIEDAVGVLRDALIGEGALGDAVEEVSRAARGLLLDLGPERANTMLRVTHQAVADALRLGQNVEGDAVKHGLDALGAAQRLLYRVVQARHLAGPRSLRVVRPSDNNDPWADRRASPRVDMNVEVSFESESNFFEGFSEDLSDGGLFVATYKLLPIGTVLDIVLTLANGHPICARAEVRWVRDLRDTSDGVSPGIGLKFVNLLPADVAAIGEFVTHRSPIFYDD